MKKLIVVLAIVAMCGSIAQAGYSSGSCSGTMNVSFSGANFVAGHGWSSGSGRTISYSGSCSGCSIGPIIYGWGTGPLVEYYIGRGGGTNAGTYSTGGGTATLYTNSCNGPNLTGTGAFSQYNVSGGNKNMGEHNTGWSGLGKGTSMGGGYQVVAVEGWSSNSGSASVSASGGSWYTLWTGSGSASLSCGGGSTTTTTTTTTSGTSTSTTTTTTTSGTSTSTTTTAAGSCSCGTCNWYGTSTPICCQSCSGWGWSDGGCNRSCVCQSTCNSQ